MTPDQIAALTAMAGLIEKLGTWKIGSLVALFAFMPDVIFVVMVCVILNKFDGAIKELRKQHGDFALKYDNNVELVQQITKIANSLQEVVILNVQTMQGVQDAIETNQWCPLVKKEGKVSVEVKQS